MTQEVQRNYLEINSIQDLNEIIESNEEGLVVRGENGPVFKIKEYHSFDMVILGYVNGYTNNFSLMKEILVGVMTEKNKFLITGVVANGFDIEQREKLSKDFEKIKVDSDSIIVSGAKIPFTMVKPIHVVEIESTDIINSTSDGFIKKYNIILKVNILLIKKLIQLVLQPQYTQDLEMIKR